MPQQPVASIQNNFTKGLVTEFTGLNFPENAATDTDNCQYTLIGNVTRRQGIDLEVNHGLRGIDRTNAAINTYKWNNAGGDGLVQLEVGQVASSIFFWNASAATTTGPLSTRMLLSSVNLGLFVAVGATLDNTKECQFTDGNGYLFIFHPSCDPIYCTYASGVVTANKIDLKIRDFAGITFGEGPTNNRPLSLTAQHQYNLMNQGWASGPTWVGQYAQSWTIALGVVAFTVSAGLVGVSAGQLVSIQSLTGTYSIFGLPIPSGTVVASATVVSYAGTTLTLNVGGIGAYAGGITTTGNLFNVEVGYINTFKSTTGIYPSNSDVWWYFKNASDAFDPATTINHVTLGQGNAPQGHILFNPFLQDRGAQSGVSGLTTVSTPKRPTNGTWHQGRIWYTGVEASVQASGDAPFYTWTESIYFSQTVSGVGDFGKCYQENDPTSENLFDLLPTDGGVIIIQGAGTVYKLFAIQNGLLVFAANGVWFITGSQGIGFSANDYTITKISEVRTISSSSFVNVLGMPYFWNEEGIYAVEADKQGSLAVNPITVGTILSLYDEIPLTNKKIARGAYDPIEYVIQWIYKSNETANFDDRYSFNRILNYNTYNKAFYPYSVDNSNARSINGITYVAGPGGVNTPPPTFKYFCSFPDVSITQFSFADEHDDTFVDWASTSSTVDFSSYFVTGYQIRGQAQKIFFPGYVWMFSNSGTDTDTAYKFNSIWDYAINSDSGRWSNEMYVTIPPVNYGVYYRRHKIRGHGIALQFKVQSVSGKNFDIIGWTSNDNVNTGI